MKRLIIIEHSLDVKEQTSEEIKHNTKFLLYSVLAMCLLGILFAVWMCVYVFEY